jgi:predicted metal-dependent HD superfamily phosphohydrolase
MGSCEERTFRVWHHAESPARPDVAALRERFGALVARLRDLRERAPRESRGLRDSRERPCARIAADDAFERVYADWSAKARRYHDAEHLADCLVELDRQPRSHERDLAELAVWYHDVVYEPGKADSEARSAARLRKDAAALGLGESLAERAAALVEATAYGSSRTIGPDAALIHDIDLGILGRDQLRFMEYEYGVSEEFAALPTLAFRIGRGRFLSKLLEQRIYMTADFGERYEATARANIAALLASPRYRVFRWLAWLP